MTSINSSSLGGAAISNKSKAVRLNVNNNSLRLLSSSPKRLNLSESSSNARKSSKSILESLNDDSFSSEVGNASFDGTQLQTSYHSQSSQPELHHNSQFELSQSSQLGLAQIPQIQVVGNVGLNRHPKII